MKKNKLVVTALLALLCLSAAGCLFSFVFGKLQDLARQERLEAFRACEQQEKAAQVLGKEHQDWRELPAVLKQFRRTHLLSLDEFAAFRRELDARLAANGLQPARIDLAFGNSTDGIRKVIVKFSLESSYRNLKKFIFDMETRSKIYFFTSLKLDAAAATVKGAFMLEVYLGE
jgi:Tfp pilus assembly protein PilO